MAGKKSSKGAADPVLSYEEAVARLEAIVRQLEAGDLSLEDSLRLFGEGVELSRHCTRMLDEAERRVERLIQSPEGKLSFEPMEAKPMEAKEAGL